MASSPSRSRRPGCIAVGIAAVIAMAGLAACGRSSSTPGRTPAGPTVPPAPAPVGPAPARPYVASPERVALTRDGAVVAAVARVTNGQALLDMDPAEAERTVRAHATIATADDQVDDLRDRLAAVHRALAGGTGPIRYWQAALATKVEAFDPPRARVSVWHVGVLSRAGVAPPQAGWAVSVVDLVWEGDDWKLDHETDTAGPAPILDASAAPVTSEQLEAALDGFSRGDER